MNSTSQNTPFSRNKTLNIKGKLVTLDPPALMGILNVTPDSFFDGGRYADESAILKRAEQMFKEGVTFIDVGGYSSRPGSVDVSAKDEAARSVNAIRSIHREFPTALLTIDTFRSEVARQALDAGAIMINDISAGELDPALPQLAADESIPYVIMHMRGTPQTMSSLTSYENLIKEMIDYFHARKNHFNAMGIKDIIIDPGFGFAKTREQNFEILKNLESFRILDTPILIGLSRKSMIWKTLGITADEALNGTSAMNAIALMKGASILRVHDVKEAKQIIALTRELL